MRQLPDANLRDDFERHGWMSPLNAEGVAAFWADMSPEIFGSIAPWIGPWARHGGQESRAAASRAALPGS
ncbi:hypothetical protein PE067_13480 [Paracoccus sp. DMF-8]|uniref:hypothetical protein n=1 Tax=Paracoccus sp. DMF-8 TaxID=3019445 RepID=UPI0023E83A48|nr:hypothetical protein [Paracoccus sp. DMF-8]MDF3607054.1 hypothetical protein [Paracoccus sp. DMF-8]